MTTTESYHDAFLRRAWERQARQEESARAQRLAGLDAASAARAETRKRQQEAAERARKAWVERRDELQAAAHTAEMAVASARQRIIASHEAGDAAAASAAALDLVVAEQVLPGAQQALAAHLRAMP